MKSFSFFVHFQEMNRELMLESSEIFEEASLIDKIRQTYIDLSTNPYKEEVEKFLQDSEKFLKKNLDVFEAEELFTTIYSCFNHLSNELIPIFDDFFGKSRSNSNYIIINAKILPILIDKLQQFPLKCESFVNDALEEILPQIRNKSNKMIIFSHQIPNQFQNDLIVDLLLSANLTQAIFLNFFPYIMNHNYLSKKPNLISLFDKISKASLNKILPQSDFSDQNFLSFLSNQNLDSIYQYDQEALSVIASSYFFAFCDDKKEIEGLNKETFLQFCASLTIILKNKEEKTQLKIQNFFEMIKEGINLLTNKNSPVLIASLNTILKNISFLIIYETINFTDFLQIMVIIIDQINNDEYKAEKILIIFTAFHYLCLFENHTNVNEFLKTHELPLIKLIFQHLEEINNYGFEKILNHKFDLKIFDENNLANQIESLSSSNDIIQAITFIQNLTLNQIRFKFKKEFCLKLNNVIDELIKGEEYDKLPIIINFMTENNIEFDKEKVKSSNPNQIKQQLCGWSSIQEDNIDNMLNIMLSDPHLEKNNKAFESLFNAMMKDYDLIQTYLCHAIMKVSTDSDISLDNYMKYFLKESEKYPKNFICATIRVVYFNSKKRMITIKPSFKIKSLKISELGLSVISKLFQSIEGRTDNFQAFLCLINIARSFPNLFNQNPHQVFDLILPSLNNMDLIFELKNDEVENSQNFLLAKTAFSAVTFLLASLQSSIVLEEFVKWFFENLTTFTKPQIFAFISIFHLFFNENKLWVVFFIFIQKYDFMNVLGSLIECDEEENNELFNQCYKEIILSYIKKLYDNLAKLNANVIIQLEEFQKLENPFINVFENSFNSYPFSFVNYFLENHGVCLKLNEFMNDVLRVKDFWLLTEFNKRTQGPSVSQVNNLISKIISHELFQVPLEKYPKISNFSIKMIRYLVVKPFWIYGLFLFDKKSLFTSETFTEFTKSYNELKEIQRQGLINPHDAENQDISTFCESDFILPFYCCPTLFNHLLKEARLTMNKPLLDLIYTLAQNEVALLSLLEFVSQNLTQISLNDYSTSSFKEVHHLIDILIKISGINGFKENFIDLCGNNLLNIVLLPRFRSDSSFLLKTYELFSEYETIPNRFTHAIGFALLLHDKNILDKIIKISFKFDYQQLVNIMPLIISSLEREIQNVDDLNIILDFIEHFPIAYHEMLPKLSNILNALLEEYSKSSEKEKITMKKIGHLFTFLAPKRSLSASLTEIINDQSTIPIHIHQTSPAFWNLFDKYRTMINEEIEKDTLLLDDFKFLLNYPELMNFKIRSSFFRKKMKDKINRNFTTELNIDMNNLFSTSFISLKNKNPEQLLRPIYINLTNSRVIDQGGVRREWFTKLAKEIFNQNYALFDSSEKNKSYQPSNNSYIHPNHLEYFEFAGKFIARALIEGICIDAHLTTSFCKQILHRQPNLKDLEDVDEDLYRSNTWILENDVEPLELMFEIDTNEFGECKTIELKENGSQIKVTNENKKEFVALHTNYILEKKIKQQIQAFCKGFDSLIPHDEIRFFTPNELDLLICGIPEIDVNDLIQHIEFEHPYNNETPVVKFFISAISKWDNEELAKLLMFMTGSSKLGVNGFREFCEMTNNPLKIAAGGKITHLPQSHTCSNTLDLPQYESEEELNIKLHKAIELCGTFENL